MRNIQESKFRPTSRSYWGGFPFFCGKSMARDPRPTRAAKAVGGTEGRSPTSRDHQPYSEAQQNGLGWNVLRGIFFFLGFLGFFLGFLRFFLQRSSKIRRPCLARAKQGGAWDHLWCGAFPCLHASFANPCRSPCLQPCLRDCASSRASETALELLSRTLKPSASSSA